MTKLHVGPDLNVTDVASGAPVGTVTSAASGAGTAIGNVGLGGLEIAGPFIIFFLVFGFWFWVLKTLFSLTGRGITAARRGQYGDAFWYLLLPGTIVAIPTSVFVLSAILRIAIGMTNMANGSPF